MSIPQSIIKAALPLQASVGREYDSAGKHVAYWYRAPGTDWKIYRHSAIAMVALLRQIQDNGRNRETSRSSRRAPA